MFKQVYYNYYTSNPDHYFSLAQKAVVIYSLKE